MACPGDHAGDRRGKPGDHAGDRWGELENPGLQVPPQVHFSLCGPLDWRKDSKWKKKKSAKLSLFVPLPLVALRVWRNLWELSGTKGETTFAEVLLPGNWQFLHPWRWGPGKYRLKFRGG